MQTRAQKTSYLFDSGRRFPCATHIHAQSHTRVRSLQLLQAFLRSGPRQDKEKKRKLKPEIVRGRTQHSKKKRERGVGR
ncbi:unnamed protein product [Periconia digitata]|uniref:Uncharacterized protein n=1 Tax=Periconia digitata TaxID=1303443 RepID=A0A9W4UUN8_9PLEO|nr:unnamed protein product [Periconia digitata]